MTTCKVFWDISNPAGYANRSGTYKTAVEHDFIRENLPSAPARILDLAGGSGRFAVPLLKEGFEVTVNDADAASLELLQRRTVGLPIDISPGDFLRADLRGPFDAVLAIECLQYFQPGLLFSRVQQLLKPGGIFIFTAMNSGSWRFRARRLIGRARLGESTATMREYCGMASAAGFEVSALRGMMWTPLTVTSNSRWVPFFARTEQALRLSNLHSQSPWLMMMVRRRC